jgi:DDE family transposase
VVEPDTGLITSTRLTAAAGADNSDAAVGIALLADDDSLAGPVEVLGDSAYGTGDALDALNKAGHTAVIKPWRLRAAIPGGFTLDDFVVDETAGTATCPHGVTRPISRTRRITFGAACLDCPLRARCTTAGRGRILHLHPHEALQRAHRARAADPAFQAEYRRHRPMVERSIAWITRGQRRVPYRGVLKNDAWLHLRIAAINLRRLLSLGLTGTDGQWALVS